jgi:acetolactate synthase I/II/III large subunit
MIDYDGPVIFDCRVTKDENCFPMIPSGAAHNEMLLGDDGRDLGSAIDEKGRQLV